MRAIVTQQRGGAGSRPARGHPGYLVSAWLLGIIVNLLLIPGYYDVALRDVGLLLAALSLARLATALPADAAGSAGLGQRRRR